MDYLKRAMELKDEVIANRRYLHRHPELAFALDNTVRFVKEKLVEMGYEPMDCGDHGVVALAGGKHGGKCVLVRADMDALPMKEESGLEFASECDTAAHTCGHDTHVAMLLGVAKILKEMEDELPGTVKLMFQPAEERLSGAKAMLAAGILENPHVDAAVGMHTIAMRETGTVGYKIGGMFSSADEFLITMHGKGCHGAQPQAGVDPINIACHTYLALQTLTSLEIGSGDNAVLTVGSIHAGKASNVISDESTLFGTFRTYDSKIRNHMQKRLVEISKGTAEMFRGTADVVFPIECPPLMTDPEVMGTMGKAVAAALGDAATIETDCEPFSGSEDFASVSEAVPAAFFFLGAKPYDYEGYSQHNAKIRFNEDAFPFGVATLSSAAVGWLEAHKE